MESRHHLKGYIEGGFRFFFLDDRGKQKIDYHYHTFHKCVIVYQGLVDYTIEGETYSLKQGDVLWVPSYEAHKVEVFDTDQYKRLVVYLSESFIEALGNGLKEKLKAIGLHYEHLQHFDDVKIFPYTFKGLETLERLGHFIPWMNRALKELNVTSQSKDFLKIDHVAIPSWVNKSIVYIRSHLDQDLPIEHIAEGLYLNKFYYMHKFKEVMGVSVHQFIVQERLKVARGMMKQGIGLTEIAYAAGFNNYTSFARAFKRVYAMSPRTFMKMHPLEQSSLQE